MGYPSLTFDVFSIKITLEVTHMGFDEIYESMYGVLETPNPNYPSEFEEGMECWKLYESILDARIRLSMAISGSEDGDLPDLMIIVTAYEHMMYHLCEKAFEYGRRDGQLRNMQGPAD